MIVQLNVTNRTDQRLVLNSQSATGQPLAPNQAVQVTFSLQEDDRGIAELHLFLDEHR